MSYSRLDHFALDQKNYTSSWNSFNWSSSPITQQVPALNFSPRSMASPSNPSKIHQPLEYRNAVVTLIRCLLLQLIDPHRACPIINPFLSFPILTPHCCSLVIPMSWVCKWVCDSTHYCIPVTAHLRHPLFRCLRFWHHLILFFRSILLASPGKVFDLRRVL